MQIFRKMDEMERNIVSRSEKIALTFAKLCLAAWCVYLLAADGVRKLVSSWPFLLLLTTVIVQLGAMQLLQWKVNGGTKDEK